MQDTSKKLLPTLITILRFRSKYLHFPVIRISHSHIVLFLIGSKRNVGSPCFLPIREVFCLVNTRFIFFVHPSIVINSFYSFIYLSLSFSLHIANDPKRNYERSLRDDASGIHVSTCRDQSRVSSKLVQLLYRLRKIGATACTDFHFNASRDVFVGDIEERETDVDGKLKIHSRSCTNRSSLPTFQRGERGGSSYPLSFSLSQFFPLEDFGNFIVRIDVQTREIGRTIFNALRGRTQKVRPKATLVGSCNGD